MKGGEIRLLEDGDPLDVDEENQLRAAVNGLLGLQVDPSTMTLNWFGGAPFLGAASPRVFQWFYTTSSITTATASATGTAIGSATMTDGYGTARRCKETGSGTSTARTPDTGTGAADETIYLPVVTATAVATGSFVLCGWTSRWEILTVVRCPGT